MGKLIKQVRVSEEEWYFIEYLRTYGIKPHQVAKIIVRYIGQEQALKELNSFIKRHAVLDIDNVFQDPDCQRCLWERSEKDLDYFVEKKYMKKKVE